MPLGVISPIVKRIVITPGVEFVITPGVVFVMPMVRPRNITPPIARRTVIRLVWVVVSFLIRREVAPFFMESKVH